MKRMHTPHYYRAGHQVRASIAARIARLVRRLFKPARLWLNAIEMRNAEDHISDMAAMHEWIPKSMHNMNRVMVGLQEQRMRIERDI